MRSYKKLNIFGLKETEKKLSSKKRLLFNHYLTKIDTNNIGKGEIVEIDDITGIIIDTSLSIHKGLGPGLLETVYEVVLAKKLEQKGFSPVVIFACIWDYDTIKMEQSRFPSVLELITGKFLRHSPEFYEWRIKDRLKRLENEPTNVNLLDDLAVAYDKTDQHDKAIAITQNTEKIKPGRYETAVNLGTFYFHSGKFEEGLPQIEIALKINPDAHFGREYYQKVLVEYLLQQRKNELT